MNRFLVAKDILSKLHILKFARGLHRKYKSVKRKGVAKKILKRGYPSLPSTIYIEPTQRCNLKCSMCYLDFSKMDVSNEMDFEKFKFIITHLPKNTKHIQFTGGEPLMSPHIIQMIDYLDKKDFATTLISNLVNTNFVYKLKNYKSIVIVNTSVDGPRELHNNIRGRKDAYDLTVKGIRIINEHFPKGTLMLVCVISKHNTKHLTSVIDLAKETGLSSVEFELERRYDQSSIQKSADSLGYAPSDFRVKESENEDFPFTFEELKENLQKVQAYGRKKKIKVHFLPEDLAKNPEQYYYRTTRKKYKLTCDGLNTSRIDSHGNVFSCFSIKKSFGNVFKTPFSKIWRSKEYVDFRKRLLKNNLMPICETCYCCKKIGKLG